MLDFVRVYRQYRCYEVWDLPTAYKNSDHGYLGCYLPGCCRTAWLPQYLALLQAGVCQPTFLPCPEVVAWVCSASRAGTAYVGAGALPQQGSINQRASVSWCWNCPVFESEQCSKMSFCSWRSLLCPPAFTVCESTDQAEFPLSPVF